MQPWRSPAKRLQISRRVDGQSACRAGGGGRRSRAGDAQGPLIEHHARFPQRRQCRLSCRWSIAQHIRLRVLSAAPARRWPAAPAPAPRWWPASGADLLDSPVRVSDARRRFDDCLGGPGQPVLMTGPAVTVFHGEIEIA